MLLYARLCLITSLPRKFCYEFVHDKECLESSRPCLARFFLNSITPCSILCSPDRSIRSISIPANPVKQKRNTQGRLFLRHQLLDIPKLQIKLTPTTGTRASHPGTKELPGTSGRQRGHCHHKESICFISCMIVSIKSTSLT